MARGNYAVREGRVMRDKLRAHGYAVDRNGPVTPRLIKAWGHFQQGGNVHKWNLHNPRAARPGSANAGMPAGAHGPAMGPKDAAMALARTVNQGVHHVAHNAVLGVSGKGGKGRAKKHRVQGPAPTGGGGPGGGAGPVPDSADPSAFSGVPEPPHGGTNTARLLNGSYADTLAGYQFDPQIHELLTQLEQGKRDTGQHQADIGNWYGQVQGAQDTARTRDTEAHQGATSVVNNALQGILQSLGGSRGAGMVGAAGLTDLAGLAAQGASQDRYNADLAPLLKNEEAGAHSREAAMASQAANQRNSQLVGLRGQRGQAVAKAHMDITQLNNAGRQTNFQNRLAQQNAALAAASLGINADQAYAGIEAQRANTQMNRQKLRLESAQQQAKEGKPNWAKLNYPDRQTVVHDAVLNAAATMAPDHWDAAYVRDQAFKLLRAGGYGSARGRKQGRARNRQSQRQIQAAVATAVQAAYQAWAAKQPH